MKTIVCLPVSRPDLAHLVAFAGVLLTSALPLRSQPLTITTFAGTAGQSGTADGTGGAARFNRLAGVAVDDIGNIYVADSTNQTIRKVTADGVVTTLAGVPGAWGAVDGAGNVAQFFYPSDVAIDGAGNVLVADLFNHTIRKVTPAGVVSTLAGTAGESGSVDGTGAAARFAMPSDVAVDQAGNIYVADKFNDAIRKITPSGVVTTFAGSPGNSGSADGTGSAARFYFPSGVATDSAGNVYVADQGNHTIRKITPGAVVTTLAGSPGASGSTDGVGNAARFTGPIKLAVDDTENLFVVDNNNHTIRKVTPGGTVTTVAGNPGEFGYVDGTGSAARFNYPNGIAIDAAGDIFIADADNHTLRKGTVGGSVYPAPYTFTTLAGVASPGDADSNGPAARFDGPEGIARNAAGVVFVADTANHTIRKIAPDGAVTTLAGCPGQSGSTDGAGSAARFNQPRGLAVDASGNVFVADYASHTIRRVAADGTVTTIAGSPGQSGSADGAGSAARFNYPRAVAVDRNGYLFVADTENHTIREVTPDGWVGTYAGSPGQSGSDDGTVTSARFNRPFGIAVDAGRFVHVADTWNNTIRKITPSGGVMTIAGSAGESGSADGTGGSARFSSPQGIALDEAANVYVADAYNETIRKVTPGGDVTTIAGSTNVPGGRDGTGSFARFNQPSGIAADYAGNILVADTDNNAIRSVTSGGVVTTLAGVAPGSADGLRDAARFWVPVGAALDSAGNLYVTDNWNRTIRKITPGGSVTTLAGSVGQSGSNDGAGSSARFRDPQGVAVDRAGNVYVSDTLNHTIRKVTPTGVVTTWAGSAGERGSTDGNGTAARFHLPVGLDTDSADNLYVADKFNHTIRKITPSGTVTTLAGSAGRSGSEDGNGSAARFNVPFDVAVDSSGNVYVADGYNCTIRKITPDGDVITLAGRATESGSVDGTGSAARFALPEGIAVDDVGNVYVVDASNHTIRQVTPTGVVTTLAGRTHSPGSADGTGSAARFRSPSSAAVDHAGNLYVADQSNHTIRKGARDIVLVPHESGTVSVTAGSEHTLGVTATCSGLNLTYQWQYRADAGSAWTNLSAEDHTTCCIPCTQRFHAGEYRVVATSGSSSRATDPVVVTVAAAAANNARLLNLSTRGLCRTVDEVLIPGFVINGTARKRLLIRAVGPTLSHDPFHVTGVLADPRMTLKRLNTDVNPARYEDVASNNDWRTNANADAITRTAAELFAFAFEDDHEAALLMDLVPGQYTVIADGVNGATGVAIVELYDADAGTPGSRLINLSNRGFCGVGDRVMIPGFVVSSEGAKTVLLRVVGPTLAREPFNVPGTMADPKLTVFRMVNGENFELFSQDNWSSFSDAAYTEQVAAQVFAFPLAAGSRDAALVLTLEPGVYTVVGASADDAGTGVVLVEVYIVP